MHRRDHDEIANRPMAYVLVALALIAVLQVKAVTTVFASPAPRTTFAAALAEAATTGAGVAVEQAHSEQDLIDAFTAVRHAVRDRAWLDHLAAAADDEAHTPVPLESEPLNRGRGEADTEGKSTKAGGRSGEPSMKPAAAQRPSVAVRRPLSNAAVLVLCYNRPELLQQTLQQLRAADHIDRFAKYISQDGSDPSTREVARGFRDFNHMMHPRTLPAEQRLQTTDVDRQVRATPGTMFLAAHYKWALDKVLIENNHSHAIIIEDDLMVSKDFLSMFIAAAPLLDSDPSLWCVSSWNDNGFADFDLPSDELFRSSFFPGLGWMLRRDTWLELSPKFPADNWDHWMRVSTTHRGRACLVPFLSRNRNLGETGTTANTDFYESFVKRVQSQPNDAPSRPFKVSTLREETYDKELQRVIRAAKIIEQAEVYLSPALFERGKSYVVPYFSADFSGSLSQALHIHPSPRTNYKGVTWLRYNGAHLFLIDRRLSELAPESVRERPDPTLLAVRASSTKRSCSTTCEAFAADQGESWTCDEGQFDFINDCEVLAKSFGGCPFGCTQGWGEDIPNMESADIGTGRPQCLVTEMAPTCTASHQLTTRLCPCVKPDASGLKRRTTRLAGMAIVGAKSAGVNCNAVCADFRRVQGTATPTHRCDDASMVFASSCLQLKRHFGCHFCRRGPAVANITVDGADLGPGRTADDPTVCQLPVLLPADCSLSSEGMLRLCSCVPI